MDVDAQKQQLLRSGCVIFPPESSEEWRNWLISVIGKREAFIECWRKMDTEERAKTYSHDDLWINKNNIDDIATLPDGAARRFVGEIIGEDFEWPKPQRALLLPGYPCGKLGSKANDKQYFLNGNLHVDGKPDDPVALLVGVLVSDVRPGVTAGQPLHAPESHIDVIDAFDQLTVFDKESLTEADREVRKNIGTVSAVSGKKGTVFVCHGALIHGMAPNLSEENTRDAVYFRIHYPVNQGNFVSPFKAAVQQRWRLPGLDAVPSKPGTQESP